MAFFEKKPILVNPLAAGGGARVNSAIFCLNFSLRREGREGGREEVSE